MSSESHANNRYLSRIIVIVLVTGSLALLFSILYDVSTLAFVGLGLTFWGMLFLLLGSPKQIENNMPSDIASSTYTTIDRILNDFEYIGKAFHIPPYPEDACIPEHLKRLREAVVYIAATEKARLPSYEEIAHGKFLLSNLKGILIVPPGIAILTDIENKLKVDFTKTNVYHFCEIMPQIILEKYNLAKEIEITAEKNLLNIKITDSAYKRLYGKEFDCKSVHLLGCPLVSAIAIALSKVTRSIVVIMDSKVSPGNSVIQVTLNTVEDPRKDVKSTSLWSRNRIKSIQIS